MKVVKDYLAYEDEKTNVMYFLPDLDVGVKSTFAILTHGYTADKSSIINWAFRLTEAGVSCALFDLPGHYLGNYSEVKDFEYFKTHAHELFGQAFSKLKDVFLAEYPINDHFFNKDELKVLLAGHSLGALLSLKALELKEFEGVEKRAVCVGLGMAPKNVVHLFDTPFYRSTLKVREQLVSPALNSDNVFHWIRDEKNKLEISNQDVHLITGVDDLVVGEDGMERFSEYLMTRNNRVTIEKPTKLPHHEPSYASSHVKKYLKALKWL
jgi:alpha-beta hydrolase superfamily lysophospholipase